jgi:hypothetical protein
VPGDEIRVVSITPASDAHGGLAIGWTDRRRRG